MSNLCENGSCVLLGLWVARVKGRGDKLKRSVDDSEVLTLEGLEKQGDIGLVVARGARFHYILKRFIKPETSQAPPILSSYPTSR